MRRYRVTEVAPDMFEATGKDDILELDLEPGDENEHVAAGRLKVLPRTYKVTGEAEVYDTQKDETFEAALPVSQEAALIAGGHIELVPDEPKSKPKGGNKRG